MGEEISKGSEFQYRFSDSAWINNIAKEQPPVIQTAYMNAVKAALMAIDRPADKSVSRAVQLEDAKSVLLNVYAKEIELIERRSNMPDNYDKDFFMYKLKTWAALVNEYRLTDAILGYTFLVAPPRVEEVSDWRLGPSLLKKFAEALYKIDPTTRQAFFLGNNVTKQFSDDAIEEIKLEMEKLKGSQKKEA